MEGFSKITLPLTQLIKKENKFIWLEECEKSFQELKGKLVFDALRKGLGYVLMQNDKVIAYASGQLKPYEQN